MDAPHESLTVQILSSFIFLFWLVYLYFVKNYGYWELRGVPHMPAVFPLGSYSKALVFSKVNHALAYDKMYRQFQGERFYGIIEIRTPCLVLRDPDLIQKILTDDFDHFTDRTFFEYNPKEYMMQSLFTMKGSQWKEMRRNLMPAYNCARIKIIYDLLDKCSSVLKKGVEEMLKKSIDVNINDIVSCYMFNIVTHCIFGAQTNSENFDKSELYRIVLVLFKIDSSLLRNLYLYNAFPIFRKVYFKKLELFKPECRDVIMSLIQKTVKEREERDLQMCDFLDLLVKLKKNKFWLEDDTKSESKSNKQEKVDHLTNEAIAGEVVAFFAGGYEKSSSVITFCLYELSCNLHVQDKLFEEVSKVMKKYDETISYQAVQEMTYMEQVIHETMRLFPILPILQRTCTQEYKLPGSDLVIERDIRVVMPIFSLHHDPQYFPQPDKFDPERFTAENNSKRHPFVYLPFGEGPRKCVGHHYGMMQVKTGLATLINNFKISLAPETKTPIELKAKTYIMQPEHSVILRLQKRKNE